MQKTIAFLFLFSVFTRLSFAQQDTLPNYKTRKIVLVSASSVLTVGSLVGLNVAWYKDYNTGKFHFFNDNAEWLQMDKVGHAYSTYQSARLMMNAFNWAGYNKKQQLFIGGSIGFAYLTAIEIMDGYSAGWGFSWGDMIADVAGSSAAITQQAFWNEQRIQLKFSYWNSGLAKYNPNLLGKNVYTQILKDYNGQRYWLSVNPSAFMKQETKFPKWLNFALGYGAFGMIGAHHNNKIYKDTNGNIITLSSFDRERRFYLSLDVDLTRIKTKSKFLRAVFQTLNIVKIPAPALQFNNKGLKFHYLYF